MILKGAGGLATFQTNLVNVKSGVGCFCLVVCSVDLCFAAGRSTGLAKSGAAGAVSKWLMGGIGPVYSAPDSYLDVTHSDFVLNIEPAWG